VPYERIDPMNDSIISTNDGRCYQKPGFTANAKAIAAATTTGTLVMLAVAPAESRCLNDMAKISQSTDTGVYRKGLSEALKKAGLEGKVGILDLNPSSGIMGPFDFLPDKIKNNKVFKYLLEKLQLDPVSAAKNGKNSFFSYEINSILTNMEKMGASGFHEIGHAINYNKSKFWRILQKSRMPLLSLSGLFMTIPLFTRKKAEGEQPKGFLDKTAAFIKENTGKLTIAAFIPVIAEELRATKRGNALAKQILSPENFKKVVKINRLGAISYTIGALFSGLAAFTMNKVRDKFAAPKEI